jgi:hypothetical protein
MQNRVTGRIPLPPLKKRSQMCKAIAGLSGRAAKHFAWRVCEKKFHLGTGQSRQFGGQQTAESRRRWVTRSKTEKKSL